MAEGKDYVVYGMKAKCSEGTMDNYISTDKGHGVVYQDQPVLNANDHVKEVNLTHFGDCNSKAIFEEAKKQADEKYKAEEGDGFFTRLGKGIAKTVTKAVVSVKKTSPPINASWIRPFRGFLPAGTIWWTERLPLRWKASVPANLAGSLRLFR